MSGGTDRELLEQMDAKLDTLLAGLKSLERRINMLEENYEHKNIDEQFADVNKIIKFFIILYIYSKIY